jgi:hypothetical protein
VPGLKCKPAPTNFSKIGLGGLCPQRILPIWGQQKHPPICRLETLDLREKCRHMPSSSIGIFQAKPLISRS